MNIKTKWYETSKYVRMFQSPDHVRNRNNDWSWNNASQHDDSTVWPLLSFFLDPPENSLGKQEKPDEKHNQAAWPLEFRSRPPRRCSCYKPHRGGEGQGEGAHRRDAKPMAFDLHCVCPMRLKCFPTCVLYSQYIRVKYLMSKKSLRSSGFFLGRQFLNSKVLRNLKFPP